MALMIAKAHETAADAEEKEIMNSEAKNLDPQFSLPCSRIGDEYQAKLPDLQKFSTGTSETEGGLVYEH